MADLDWSSIPGAIPYLWKGFLTTLKITVAAIFFGTMFGTILAIFRISKIKWLSWFAFLYVSLFRSVPLVMVLLWFFLIVPQVITKLFGIGPETDVRLLSAMVGFSLFEAAYYSEIIRAGIEGISKGQWGAARALGMSTAQAMRLVILPQAFSNMTPLLLTQAIILFQDTSLVYVLGLADFFGAAYKVGERDGRLVEMLLFVGLIYFLVSYVVSLGVRSWRKGWAL